MRKLATIWMAKGVARAARLRGGSGGALPGKLAEQWRPGLMRELGAGLTDGIILVTGTNGKTTTTKLLREVLANKYQAILSNRSGSNLSRGVLSSLIANVDGRGRPRARLGLFEVDEAAMPRVAAELQPSVIVVTNLFRDQLDRYGELDSTAGLLRQAIEAAPQAQVYLNADDPLVVSLGVVAEGRVHYYGVAEAEAERLASDETADSQHCPVCGRELDYSRRYYGHIGLYGCPQGDFRRPEVEVAGQVQPAGEGQRLRVGATAVTLALPGLYNAYNALAAWAVAVGLGVAEKTMVEALERSEAAFGRVERVSYRGRELYLVLIKNPTGFTQVLQTFVLGKTGVRVVLAINDNYADGRDVSWLWDVPLEELAGTGAEVVASGIRAADMQLRLKYAGVEAERQEDTLAAVRAMTERAQPGETIYVLPTYTAMLGLRRQLGREIKLAGINE